MMGPGEEQDQYFMARAVIAPDYGPALKSYQVVRGFPRFDEPQGGCNTYGEGDLEIQKRRAEDISVEALLKRAENESCFDPGKRIHGRESEGNKTSTPGSDSQRRRMCEMVQMSRATRRIRDLAAQLIAYESESGAGEFSEVGTPAAFHVSEKLRPHLAMLMGSAGFRALISRGLALASADVPWLRAVHVKTDGSLI